MGYYCLLIGGLISASALWSIVSTVKLLMFGLRAQGTIVSTKEILRRGGSRTKQVYYHPVIEFETEEGRVVTFTFGGGSSSHRPNEGETVTVIYNLDHPQDATLNTFPGLWAGPLAAALLGGAVLYAGVDLLFLSKHSH
jgi:hypothetical protein